ncbi:hypothetical protein C8C99_4421 [Acidovorax sp. 107]|nr:hypothetical protein C8C99_4421 [Acidovorax sp. 107]
MEEPFQVRVECQDSKKESFCQGFRRSSGTEPHSSGQMSWGFLALTTHCNANTEAVVMAKRLRVVIGGV